MICCQEFVSEFTELTEIFSDQSGPRLVPPKHVVWEEKYPPKNAPKKNQVWGSIVKSAQMMEYWIFGGLTKASPYKMGPYQSKKLLGAYNSTYRSEISPGYKLIFGQEKGVFWFHL